jgi:dTDP-4-amino-4,6-dideoxygalactose transaminase
MTGEQLAANGGPRTIRSRLALHRVQLRRGLLQSWALLEMIPFALRSKMSIAGGCGIVPRFEDAFCKATGADFALSMNSGTAALHSAYFAVGVGPGTEVIVPAYTWHATATPILQCGAVPAFCEIDPGTLAADPVDIERRINERTRAICVLHAWGNPAPMDRIVEIADRHGVAVIEDCSHAHGASYQGKPVGTWGDIGCFSLGGGKAVPGGEAGIAITNDATFYDRMLLLGHNDRVSALQKARTFDYGDISLGVKYRPHVAALYLARAALGRLGRRNAGARRAWATLCHEFRNVPGIRPVETPDGAERGGFYAFTFRYDGAELGGPGTQEFVAAVQAEGAPLRLDEYRGRLLHKLPLFTELHRPSLGGGCYDPTRPWEENISKCDLPVTEYVTDRLVSFPPELWGVSESYVRKCARAVKKVLAALLPETQQSPRSDRGEDVG